VRLLLDEMFPATIAGRLRIEHGHDVSGVSERDDLRGLADIDVFRAAQSEERAIATENVRDFRPIAREWQSMGRVHFGLVLTTDRRVPRANSRTVGRLGKALHHLLEAEAGRPVASNREIWL